MTPSFQLVQQAFTQFVRGKTSALPTGVSFDKMALYKTLVLNNLDDVISPCFPVLRTILPNRIWSEILEQFLQNHHATTPLFHQIAKEFVVFLKDMFIPKYPFIHALAHYEWIELDVEIAEEIDAPGIDTGSVKLLDTTLTLKSTARLLYYQFDVENIGIGYQPAEPVDTFLCVYRDDKGKVQFIKLNQLSYSVLLIMQRQELTARQVIQQMANLLPSLDSNQLMSTCSIFIAHLYDEGIFQPPF